MRRLDAIPFVWLLLPMVVAIIIIYYIKPTIFYGTQPEWVEKQSILKVQIVSVPESGERYEKTEVEVKQIIDSVGIKNTYGKMLLYIWKDSLSICLKQGDILVVSVLPRHSNRGNPYEFDYDNYLMQRGVYATSFVKSDAYKVIGNSTLYNPVAVAQRCRSKIIRLFERYNVKGQELGVLSALTIGDRSELDADTKRNYQVSGAMHVLAVSGLHVGIVYGAVYILLSLFGFFPVLYHQTKRKMLNAFALLFVLWIYAFLTGLSPSVVRASLMLSLYTIAKAINRQADTYNIIFASAFLTLCFKPLSLFTISFQLSYAAVLSIVFFQPKISRLIRFRFRVFRWIWGLFTVSLAAQIGTIPITLWYFSQISNYFVLTNFIVIPLATIILYLALLFFIVLPIPYIRDAVAWLLGKVVWLQNIAVDWIESLPASATILSITLPMLLTLLALILFIAIYLISNRWQWLVAIVVLTCILIVLHIFHLREINKTNRLILFNSQSLTFVNQQGRQCKIITEDISQALWLTENLRKKEMITIVDTTDISQNSSFSFNYKNQEYLIAKDSLFKKQNLKKQIDCDYLLLSAYISPYQNILEKINVDTIILLPPLRQWQQEKISHTLDSISVPYVIMREYTPKIW